MSTVGVFAAVFDKSGRILLVHQAYGPRRWTQPGGRLEPGESPIDGVLREILEETGIKATVVDYLGTYVAMYKDDVVFMFHAEEIDRETWTPNDEISAVEYFAESSLPEEVAFNTRVRIQDAFAGRRGVFRVFDTPESIGFGSVAPE